MDGPLADGGAVLSAPLSDFAGLLEIPLFTEKLESRGTHRVVVSIFPPSWVDGELTQRLLEFFEEEFNAEAAGAISGAIEGSTIFMLTSVPTEGADTLGRVARPPTIIGALAARLGSFGMYSSYLLTRPGSPSQVLFPQLGSKPWQRRGIGGFLLALARATAAARGYPPEHYLQSARLSLEFYAQRGFEALPYESWPKTLRDLVTDRTWEDCRCLVQNGASRAASPTAAAAAPPPAAAASSPAAVKVM